MTDHISKEEKTLNENTQEGDENGKEEIDFDMFGEHYIFEDDEDKPIDKDNLEDYNEKVRKTGVVYISYIPEGMTVGFLRTKLAKYGVTRIYLIPNNNAKGKKRSYKEGWIEFSNKLMAKLCEYELNGQMIGGKKRKNQFREELWTLKYLNKFKWHHLMEKLNFNRKVREQRMKAEISQIRRENNFLVDKFEKSRMVNRLNKKRVRYIYNIIIGKRNI